MTGLPALCVAVCRAGARWWIRALRELRPGHGGGPGRCENSGKDTVSRCGVARIGAGARREGRDAGRRVLLAARDVPRLRIPRRPGEELCPGPESCNARPAAPRPGPELHDAPARHRAPVPDPATPPPGTVPQPVRPQRALQFSLLFDALLEPVRLYWHLVPAIVSLVRVRIPFAFIFACEAAPVDAVDFLELAP